MEPQNSIKTPSSPQPSSTPYKSFKSKKILRSSSKSIPSDEKIQSKSTPIDSNTPQTPKQVRTRGVAFTINQVKKAAQTLNKSGKVTKSDDELLQFTPDSKKKLQISPKKPKNSIKLPERYELLGKFFDDMISSIRLLQMKGTKRSFTNISPSVEILSDRRFSYTYLAQMKYILPEAIELKKIVLVDQRTMCTKSDLEVILVPDAIESVDKGKRDSGYANLSKVFQIRLLEFHKTHPEEEEIPLGELPYPFNSRLQTAAQSSNQSSTSPLPVHSSADIHPRHTTISASHLSRSFKSRFTQKVLISESEKTQLSSASIISSSQLEEAAPLSRDIFPKPNLSRTPVAQTVPGISQIGDKEVELKKEDCSTREMFHSEMTPVKPSTSKLCTDTPTRPDEIGGCSSEETPAKLISTPARLMSATPDLQTPKRCHIVQEDASTPANKLVRRPPKRPLFLTPTKNKKIEDEVNETKGTSKDAYLINLLPDSLRHSLMEKEKQSSKEKSKNGDIITKAELMHKIITSHMDVTDRAELEEQFKLLKELVPDWIQEKIANSGDHLFCINRRSCPDSVRRRLTEAI
ncbi:hypothetical protein ACHQM5_027228 [Ranunculus cassubicifolius]